MRGTSFRYRFLEWRVRIIPAGAGHLGVSQLILSFEWDHPRRCGALKDAYGTGVAGAGSSPQVRGTYPLSFKGRNSAGIIPAGAGHFYNGFYGVHSAGDHPRRCGALIRGERSSAYISGSSPQVRGTCKDGAVRAPEAGIIPAGAGHFFLPRL